MNKNLILRLITLLLIGVNMFVIFNFSSEKAETSRVTSKKVTETVLEITVKDYEIKPEPEKKALVKKFDVKIRSLAHFSEYTLLGFLLALHLSLYKLTKIKKASLAAAGCLLYALSDEIHQIYVPGRSFQFSDLLVDTLGGLLGILILFIFAFILKKITKKPAVSSAVLVRDKSPKNHDFGT